VTLLHEITGAWPDVPDRVAAMVFSAGALPGTSDPP
jgi:hypothetical protein